MIEDKRYPRIILQFVLVFLLGAFLTLAVIYFSIPEIADTTTYEYITNK